eukprot:SAG11_NODE_11958_length_729_cov_0.884127_1_plen_194_part_10
MYIITATGLLHFVVPGTFRGLRVEDLENPDVIEDLNHAPEVQRDYCKRLKLARCRRSQSDIRAEPGKRAKTNAHDGRIESESKPTADELRIANTLAASSKFSCSGFRSATNDSQSASGYTHVFSRLNQLLSEDRLLRELPMIRPVPRATAAPNTTAFVSHRVPAKVVQVVGATAVAKQAHGPVSSPRRKDGGRH